MNTMESFPNSLGMFDAVHLELKALLETVRLIPVNIIGSSAPETAGRASGGSKASISNLT